MAATLTSWSNPHAMKSANCISAHRAACPRPPRRRTAPMIEFSASGVSRQRSAPNSSTNPSVTLNAPPNGPDVLAEAEHGLVAAHLVAQRRRRSPRGRSSRVPRSWSGLATSVCGPATGAVAPAIGPAPSATTARCPSPSGSQASAKTPSRRQRRARASASRAPCARPPRPPPPPPGGLPRSRCSEKPCSATQSLDVAVDGVATAPLLEQLLRHVAHVVVGAVPVHAHRVALDQRRALAAARALGRDPRRLEHRLDVVAVHGHAREAVARGALDRVDRVLERAAASSTRTCCSRARRPPAAGGCRRSSSPRATGRWRSSPRRRTSSPPAARRAS